MKGNEVELELIGKEKDLDCTFLLGRPGNGRNYHTERPKTQNALEVEEITKTGFDVVLFDFE